MLPFNCDRGNQYSCKMNDYDEPYYFEEKRHAICHVYIIYIQLETITAVFYYGFNK